MLPTTSTSMAHPSPKIHICHSQTCVLYAVNASQGAFKAVLRTFLGDVGTSRVLNEHPIQKCGEKPRPVDQTPVLGTRDLRFCYKNQVVLGSSRLFPALTSAAIKNPLPQSENATTSSSRGNIKGPLPETKQRPFFVSASRRVRDDCITEDFLS